MDRFSELQAFVAVADAGGFNAAARALGRSPPTVTRLVAGLEDRIGTRLFLRTTRQVGLTEAGERLLTDARRVLEDLETAEAAAAGAHEAPQGTLSVTAPVIFGRRYIAPLLRRFLDRYPGVTARALFLDRNVNLIEEGLDVALRIGALPSSSLTALRVGEVRWVTVAAPDYLDRHGTPVSPDDLSGHRLAAAGLVTRTDAWQFAAQGHEHRVAIAPALVTNALDAAVDAATEGWAITRLLSYQVADHLRDGRLVEVLAEYEDRRLPVHLLHAEGPLRAAKIRAFVDHAAQSLRREARHWTP